MYSVSIRNSEKVAVPRMSPPTFAPATVFVRRIPKRISGSARPRSPPPHAASTAGAAARPPRGSPPPDRAPQRARPRDDADRSHRAPAIRAALGDRVHERHEAGRHEHGAEGVV